MADAIVLILSLLGAITIITYATWLLTVRVRYGDSKRKSFFQWLQHLFDALWGHRLTDGSGRDASNKSFITWMARSPPSRGQALRAMTRLFKDAPSG